jgi:hypothetical protein
MASRPAINPYGGLTQLSDRLIGDAFPVIKEVYDNMASITAIGAALTGSVVGAPLLTQRCIKEYGGVGALGSTIVIPFTDVDLDLARVLSSSVKIIGNDGALYFADSGVFTARVTTIGLALTLKADAPVACSNALVEWFIVYGV